jgi:prepilin-type N-terminal cleavage/methylation domain-containing protein
MRNDGVSLIELLVVVSIIGLLIIAMGFSYEGWMGNYRLESQTKDLYFDLADARSNAMSHNRVHWVVLEEQQYTIYEDTNPAPDGDGVLNIAADTQVVPTPPNPGKRYEYGFRLQGLGAAALPQTITFNTRGLMDWVPAGQDIRFWFISPPDSLGRDRDPDFDCIVIERSKIWTGEYDQTNLICERR